MRDPKNELTLKKKDGASMPAHVKDQVDAFMIEASGQRQVLDILRKTRGQRVVGTVTIPAHLRQAEAMSDAGVEVRGMVANVLPAKD